MDFAVRETGSLQAAGHHSDTCRSAAPMRYRA